MGDSKRTNEAQGQDRIRDLEKQNFELQLESPGNVDSKVEFSEVQLKAAALDAQRDTFFLFEPDTRKAVLWNKTFNDVSGYSDEEIAAMKAPESYFNSQDLARAAEKTSKVLSGEAATFEMDLITKSGKVVPTEYTGTPILDANGKPKYIISIGRDISDRRQLEAELQERLRFEMLITDLSAFFIGATAKSMEALITRALTMIVEFFGAGRAVIFEFDEAKMKARAVHSYSVPKIKPYVENAESMAMFSFAAEKILRQKTFLFSSLAELPEEAASLRRYCEQEGITAGAAIPLIDSDTVVGTLSITMFEQSRTWSSALVARFELLGNLVASALARQRMVTALRENELLFRTAIESIPHDLFALDRDQRYTIQNTVSRENWGDIIGLRPEDIAEDEVSLSVWKENNKQVLCGKTIRKETVMTVKGEKRFVHNTIAPITDQGRLTGILGINIDLTERKKMEEHLRQVEKMEAIGQLAGGIAHDFNNQLGSILGLADLLHDAVQDNPTASRYCDFIIRAVERSSDLTSKLLAFSRKGNYVKSPVDINRLIKEIAEMLGRTVDKRISIGWQFQTDEAVVLGDASQLQNTLLNLSLNARDAMPEGGRLSFRTAIISLDAAKCRKLGSDLAPGKYLNIIVKDTGTGIVSEIKSRIFEPFFTTKEAGKGTGMGLAAVYGTVIGHSGAIDVQSATGEGTEFSLFLPFESGAPPKREAWEKNEKISGQKHIMIVDDEDLIREVTGSMLRSLGYKVTICRDGKQAVEYFSSTTETIDLVVLDLVMPKLRGKAVFHQLKRRLPEVKVLISSGYSLEGEAQQLIDAGADGFIQKPFRKADLASSISGILGFGPNPSIQEC